MSETRTEWPDRYSAPGHDRDVLQAMWSQLNLGRPLSRIQVEHMARIAWTAGATAEHEAMHEGVTDDCREVFAYATSAAQSGYSGTKFVESVTRVYGPTLPWRRRLSLAVYLAFRKGYSR